MEAAIRLANARRGNPLRLTGDVVKHFPVIEILSGHWIIVQQKTPPHDRANHMHHRHFGIAVFTALAAAMPAGSVNVVLPMQLPFKLYNRRNRATVRMEKGS